MIIVAGHLRVVPGARDQVLRISREAVVLARATPGCHDFGVGPDLVEADRVNVFERWTDSATLKAFRGSGPNPELQKLILEFHVEEFEVR